MFPQLGFMEMLVVMGVAVLLFGKRLPEVGRSLGKGLVEFKKGLRGIEETFDFDAPLRSSSRAAAPERLMSAHSTDAEMSVPKFEPPVAEPEVPKMELAPHPAQD